MWAEQLPDGCPPPKAQPPNDSEFFRLVDRTPPAEKDFFSLRKLFPDRQFNATECQARALSVFDSLEQCENLRKLPNRKKQVVVKLKLPREAGVVLQTGKNKNHFSWWLSQTFNPTTAVLAAPAGGAI